MNFPSHNTVDMNIPEKSKVNLLNFADNFCNHYLANEACWRALKAVV